MTPFGGWDPEDLAALDDSTREARNVERLDFEAAEHSPGPLITGRDQRSPFPVGWPARVNTGIDGKE